MFFVLSGNTLKKSDKFSAIFQHPYCVRFSMPCSNFYFSCRCRANRTSWSSLGFFQWRSNGSYNHLLPKSYWRAHQIFCYLPLESKGSSNRYLKKYREYHDFAHYFLMILCAFLVFFSVDFRSLGSSKVGVSCRRNTDFHKFGVPKAHSKNESPQRSGNSNFGVNFWPILRFFVV